MSANFTVCVVFLDAVLNGASLNSTAALRGRVFPVNNRFNAPVPFTTPGRLSERPGKRRRSSGGAVAHIAGS
jgi:hypothetical protein